VPLESLSSIARTRVDWLWPDFVPLGKFTDVAGEMGQGKSLFTLWLAAQVTSREVPGSVLLYAAEDDYGDTIRPRLEAAHADLTRIHRVTDHALDANALSSYCDDLGDVALVIADPISAYISGNVWKTPDVRRFLTPLTELAQKRRFALVGIQHLNRGDHGEALDRIADARGFPQVARSVLAWGPDPNDPDDESGSLKVIAVAKGNLVHGRPAAAFRIETHGESVRVTHLGGSTASANDVVANAEARTLTQQAADWLCSYLASGPVEQRQVVDAARDAGITEKPLRMARKLVAVSERRDSRDVRSPYVWRLA
jgi:putative DNA primase/helicase